MKMKLMMSVVLIAGLSYANQKIVVDVDSSGDSCKDDNRITAVAEVLNDDFLFLGNKLAFSGEAQDLVFLGKTLAFSGTTRLGFLGAGKTLDFSGTTGNGICAAGGNVVVDGRVTGNNYIACKSLQLTGKAIIDGNLFLACAKGRLDGTLDGDLYCGAGELVVNGVINGNVKAYGGRIIIGEKGKINGNLTYGTREKMSVEDLTRVSGKVTLDEKHVFDRDRFFNREAGKAAGFIFGAAFCLSVVIVGCLLLFIPVFGKLELRKTDRAFWNTALYGLVPLLMYPAAIVMSFALVVTIPLGVVLLLAGIPLLFFAWIIGTTLAGGYLSVKFGWNVQKRHWHFLIGALAGALVSVIPFINFLWFVLMGALGWGVYLGMLRGGTTTGVNMKIASTGAAVVNMRGVE